MDVRLFRDRGLGNGSYLVRVADGRAVLVDPDRRTRRYLAAAEDRSLEIVAVLETHLHADFVSGALEIRAATGAEVYEPAEAGVSFPHRPVEPGERLDLGGVEVEALATPGHAPEHLAYVFRHPGEAAPVLFSGGALIVGGAARTDLSGPELTEHLTRHAFETLQHAFADLPGETPLMPTHGSGSFCSTGSGREHTSTLGEERATNPLLSMSDHTFMESWPATFPRTPAYFSRMREVNWAGPRLRTDIEMPRPLAPKAFADAASEPGSIVVDVRDPGSYAEAHGEGALAIPFRDSFPTWLGWLVPADARLLLVLGDDPLDDVVDACALVGFERVRRVPGRRDRGVARGRSVRPLAPRDRCGGHGAVAADGCPAPGCSRAGRAGAWHGRGRGVRAPRGSAAGGGHLARRAARCSSTARPGSARRRPHRCWSGPAWDRS